jgi:Rps23 Pro-64 3,4-dihydroxylase Tpa1-like proline 4-hydroxylase
MLTFLESLTGIHNLIGDPTFVGGGVHQTLSQGKLDIHADFNVHLNHDNIYRRINLLLYITPYWEDQWGGKLQLWEKDLSKSCIEIPPVFNRAVIFNTNSDSFHGHPKPMQCPPNVARRSLALYYYTDYAPDEARAAHPVQWKRV